jgi:hypothetical protein
MAKWGKDSKFTDDVGYFVHHSYLNLDFTLPFPPEPLLFTLRRDIDNATCVPGMKIIIYICNNNMILKFAVILL